jgi:hypothetical protein
MKTESVRVYDQHLHQPYSRSPTPTLCPPARSDGVCIGLSVCTGSERCIGACVSECACHCQCASMSARVVPGQSFPQMHVRLCLTIVNDYDRVIAVQRKR